MNTCTFCKKPLRWWQFQSPPLHVKCIQEMLNKITHVKIDQAFGNTVPTDKPYPAPSCYWEEQQ